MENRIKNDGKRSNTSNTAIYSVQTPTHITINRIINTSEEKQRMEIKIALAGNPNSGKTTLFNALTGANQFVGNWPGVTVEKKEGKLKKHNEVIITDLPGIYSLSPYTLEEVVARNYLITQRPNAILNLSLIHI